MLITCQIKVQFHPHAISKTFRNRGKYPACHENQQEEKQMQMKKHFELNSIPLCLAVIFFSFVFTLVRLAAKL
jgi:hypothetical protein